MVGVAFLGRSVVVVVVASIALGCAVDDPVLDAASAICDAIDQEPSDVLAFEGYVRALSRERRAGVDEAALQAAIEERCGRAVSVIAAAAEQSADDPPESESDALDESAEPAAPQPEPEPEVEFVDLASLDWLEQSWATECTSDGQMRDVRLVYEEEGNWARHRPTVGITPVYEVEFGAVTYGDVTGDGYDDAVFVTQCVFANAQTFLEVWSHDEQGLPVQLPLVVDFSKFEEMLDRVEAVDGRLRVHTFEGAAGDSAPHINGYPVEVVTDWAFDAGEWVPQEVQRSVPEPEPAPESAISECQDPGSSPETASLCLRAAAQAGDFEAAERAAGSEALRFMRESRDRGNDFNAWQFDGCGAPGYLLDPAHFADVCSFYAPPYGEMIHGVTIEFGLIQDSDGYYVAQIETIG